jgi:hypothetical protein
VDVSVIFDGTEALVFAVVLTGVAILGKWAAAWVAQQWFGYNILQRTLLFGLSSAHAAATIAVIMVGYNLGMLDEKVLNGTILLILVTCMLSSFMVEHSAKELVINEVENLPASESERPERILVPMANPANASRLLELAFMLRDPKGKFPVFPLMVVKDNQEAEERIRSYQKAMQQVIKEHLVTGVPIQPLTKIEPSNSLGIVRTTRELLITTIVMGWHTKIRTTERIFGTALDKVLQRSGEMIVVGNILAPLNTFSHLEVFLPPNAEVEIGFGKIIQKTMLFAGQMGAKLTFRVQEDTWLAIETYCLETKTNLSGSFQVFEEWHDFADLAQTTKSSTLLWIGSARKGTASHADHLDNLPLLLSENFTQTSFLVVFPEQFAGD